MAVLIWARETRETLRERLPGSVVVLPMGATEQHGGHLPTGTDLLVASAVAEGAAAAADAELAGEEADFLVLPGIPFGVSGHHLPFGGTIALRSTTLLAVLGDVIDSLEQQGARKLVIVNGHGGNTGVATAAASEADARDGISVASLDYWNVLPGRSPGHAGRVETSLLLRLAPDLVSEVRPRERVPEVPDVSVPLHGGWIWRAIGGVTDDPWTADAELGRAVLDDAVAGLARILVSLWRLDVAH